MQGISDNTSPCTVFTQLTSTSLCLHTRTQPVELLPQTLEEFSVSSSGLGLHQGTLTTVYHEAERLRRRKLQAARREREKIIAEESSREMESRREVDRDTRVRLIGSSGTTEKSSKRNLPTATLTNKVQETV